MMDYMSPLPSKRELRYAKEKEKRQKRFLTNMNRIERSKSKSAKKSKPRYKRPQR